MFKKYIITPIKKRVFRGLYNSILLMTLTKEEVFAVGITIIPALGIALFIRTAISWGVDLLFAKIATKIKSHEITHGIFNFIKGNFGKIIVLSTFSTLITLFVSCTKLFNASLKYSKEEIEKDGIDVIGNCINFIDGIYKKANESQSDIGLKLSNSSTTGTIFGVSLITIYIMSKCTKNDIVHNIKNTLQNHALKFIYGTAITIGLGMLVKTAIELRSNYYGLLNVMKRVDRRYNTDYPSITDSSNNTDRITRERSAKFPIF